jgi:hypothetical protein
MPESSLPVEHLFTLTASTGAPAMTQGGPQGNRLIVNAPAGRFEGPKLCGSLEPPGGDWVTLRADGSLKLDVRLTLRTDDGAVILMTYQGIGIAKGRGLEIRTAPLFETGDERYAWLNRTQAVGVGTTIEGGVRYEVYALL